MHEQTNGRRRAQLRRPSPGRIARAVATALLAGLALVAVASTPAAAAPANVQMPFPCGETWYASTYAGHQPSEYAIDWNLLGDDAGRSVRAGVTGTATVKTFDDDGYGNWVEVNAGNGWTFRYAHLSTVTVSNGPVSPTTEIGKVGNTGGSQGSHLHYEQRYNDVPQAATFNGTAVSYAYGWPGNPYTSANCGAAAASGSVIRIRKTTFGSAQQVFSATPTQVRVSAWWPGSNGVQNETVMTAPAGETIVDIDKITQADGVTQNLYTATTTGVYETWWNGNGYSNPAKIVSLANVKRVVADLKLESGTWTHRLYVLAADGPYEVWWRDGGPVSNPYRLWNINNGHSIVKSVALDGKDEVYVGTPSNVYRMKWPVNGGIERVTVTQLADTVDIARHTVGTTEYLYTATKTGVHETWWTGTSGFSNPAKIATAPSGFETVSIAKSLTGSYQQLYVAYKGSSMSRTYEYWWGPGSNGVQGGQLKEFPNQNIVDIEKSVNGSYQYLYTAIATTVYETWWGGGSIGTGIITEFAS